MCMHKRTGRPHISTNDNGLTVSSSSRFSFSLYSVCFLFVFFHLLLRGIIKLEEGNKEKTNKGKQS